MTTSVARPLRPARMGARFAADAIDGLISCVSALAVVVLLGRGVPSAPPAVLALALLVGLWLTYLVNGVGRTGRTIGKAAVGIDVVDVATGGLPTTWAATKRALLLSVVGLLTCGLGDCLVVLSAYLDSTGRRRGWDDVVAGTMVVPSAGRDSSPAARNGAPTQETDSPRSRVPDPPASTVTPPPEARRVPEPEQPPADPLPPPPGPRVPEAADLPGTRSPIIDGFPGRGRPVNAAAAVENSAADVEVTVIACSRRTPRDVVYQLKLEDGRTIPMARGGVMGRAPTARGEGDPQLVLLVDPTRSVSKTHLAFGLDDRGPWIMDTGSTNGTVIDHGDHTVRCEPRRRQQVTVGAAIHVGDHVLRVTSR